MRRILVTGGAGNIGAALVNRLILDPSNRVVAVDNLLTGNRANLPAANPRWEFIEADVNRLDEIAVLMKSQAFDVVFHYAAVVGVQRTLQRPLAVLNDINGIRNVLDLCHETGVKRIFYSSSSEVYGEPVEIPQHEKTTPLNSRLPYAIVKNVGEAYIQTYFKEYGLDYTIFRFFNTYGPLQSEDFVIARFIKAARKNEPLTIYGEGNQTRTFCFIDDNLEMTLQCLNNGHFINEVVNVGSDQEITIRSLADLVIKVLASSSRIVHLPALKEGDMARRKPDIQKMRSVLSRPLMSLEQGILKVADHYRNQIT